MSATRHGALHGKLVRRFVGMRLSFPTVVADAFGLRQYVACEPHSMGIKLYVLADNGGGYIFDVYLYTARRGNVRHFGSCCGKYDAKGIMRLWAKMIPQSTVLCADSFFGSHALAEEFTAQRRPFLMLPKRDKRDAGTTRTAALT